MRLSAAQAAVQLSALPRLMLHVLKETLVKCQKN